MLEALAIIKLSEFVIVHEFVINFYKHNNSFTEIPKQPLKAVRATLNTIFWGFDLYSSFKLPS